MNPLDAPASWQFNPRPNSLRLEDAVLPVVAQFDLQVFIDYKSLLPELARLMKPGVLVRLEADNNILTPGTIVAVDRDRKELEVRVSPPASFYKTCRFWGGISFRRPEVTIVDYQAFEKSLAAAELAVATRVPDGTAPGSVCWTLFYESGSTFAAIVLGNDARTPTQCHLTLPAAIWKAGNYLLKARRLNSARMTTASSAEYRWTVDSPKSKLSCGGPGESSPPLFLG